MDTLDQRLDAARAKLGYRSHTGLEAVLSYDDLLALVLRILRSNGYHGSIKQHREQGWFIVQVTHWRQAVQLWHLFDRDGITGRRENKAWRGGCNVRVSYIRKRDGKRVLY